MEIKLVVESVCFGIPNELDENTENGLKCVVTGKFQNENIELYGKMQWKKVLVSRSIYG